MIAGLLQPGMSGWELRDTEQAPALHADEEIHVANAGEKRRRDFAAGRTCARAALAPLGHGAAAIGRGDDGAPHWPPGMVGTITHTDGYAAAVVGSAQHFAGLGIDAERVGGVTPDLWRRLFSETEQAMLAARADTHVAATILFSAKEASFKALRLPRALGFRDIAITLEEHGTLEERSFTAAHAGNVLRGRYAVENGLVLTLAWL